MPEIDKKDVDDAVKDSSDADLDKNPNDNPNPDDKGGKQTVAYDTYSRNLSKLKKTEDEKDALAEENRKLKEDKLKAEGNKDELIKNLETNNAELREKNKNNTATFAYNTLQGQVSTLAVKMGCQDTDLLMLAMGDDLAKIETDDDFKGDSAKITELLETFKKSKPLLFEQDSPNLNDGEPKSKVDKANKDDYMAERRKCTTQNQLDAVMKKYNKF